MQSKTSGTAALGHSNMPLSFVNRLGRKSAMKTDVENPQSISSTNMNVCDRNV